MTLPNKNPPQNDTPTMRAAHRQMTQMAEDTSMALQSAAIDFMIVMVNPTIQNAVTIWQRGLTTWQDRMTTLATDTMHANVRATREFLQRTDPKALFQAQSQFMNTLHNTLTSATSAQPAYPHQEDINVKSVSDVMSRNFRVADRTDTVQHVAQIMRDENSGIIAVTDADNIVGIVTEHDIAIRMVAEARDAAMTQVGEVVTPDKRYVFEDVNLDQAAANMIEQKVSSLPVVSRTKRLVGIVKLVDLVPEGNGAKRPRRDMNGASDKSSRHEPSAGE